MCSLERCGIGRNWTFVGLSQTTCVTERFFAGGNTFERFSKIAFTSKMLNFGKTDMCHAFMDAQ
jgi:hypothetical protein